MDGAGAGAGGGAGAVGRVEEEILAGFAAELRHPADALDVFLLQLVEMGLVFCFALASGAAVGRGGGVVEGEEEVRDLEGHFSFVFVCSDGVGVCCRVGEKVGWAGQE